MASATELKRAQTPTLEIAYEQTGPDDGEPILLLHGFPYSPRCFDEVRDRLAANTQSGEARRLIVPYLRGYGGTRYRSPEVFRSGQQAAFGKDILDLLDALGIECATLAGYDWGGRGACVAAALWPERVRALVSGDGYDIQKIAASGEPKDVEQEHQLWYQWYFQTERGRAGLRAHRREIAHKLWTMWSPGWTIPPALFEAEAAAFANDDFVDTVIQSYRHRYGNAAGDPALEALEQRLAAQPTIAAPTIVLHGEDDRVKPAAGAATHREKFTGFYEWRGLPGVGHCPPQEAPAAFAQAVEDVLAQA